MDQYLTHYWPITNGTILDEKGSSNMVQGALTNFTSDRFGCPNAALAFNSCWTYVPSGIYFDSSEFTISVWIYPQKVDSESRVIDFGNGQSANNIILSLSAGNSLEPSITILSGSTVISNGISSQTLTLNSWLFLVATFNGTNSRIYLNGILTGQSNQIYSLPTLTRTNCFIGKSNWASNGYSSSYLDDLRFYNKSLTQDEIFKLMNQNGTCKFIFIYYTKRKNIPHQT